MEAITGSSGWDLFDRLSVNKERIMILNDGIFAIAITLLVLNLSIPEVSSGEIDLLLLPSLGMIYPKIIGFVLSFFIITSYWLSYHRIFSFIGEIDLRLITLNIFFLFFIAFMPFPTYLLGLYGAHVSVVIFYAIVTAISSFLLYLMWIHAVNTEGLLNQDLDAAFIEYLTVRNLAPAGVFVVSILVALYVPLVAMFMWVSLAGVYPLLTWRYRRRYLTAP
jgi:uncharacterized membrane protein